MLQWILWISSLSTYISSILPVPLLSFIDFIIPKHVPHFNSNYSRCGIYMAFSFEYSTKFWEQIKLPPLSEIRMLEFGINILLDKIEFDIWSFITKVNIHQLYIYKYYTPVPTYYWNRATVWRRPPVILIEYFVCNGLSSPNNHKQTIWGPEYIFASGHYNISR